VQSEKGVVDHTGPGEPTPKNPVAEEPSEWAGSKLSLDQHLQALADLVSVRALRGRKAKGRPMPVLNYLADTNTLSDYFRHGTPVKQWSRSPGQIGISTLSLAEMRRGTNCADSKAAGTWSALMIHPQDYQGAIFVF